MGGGVIGVSNPEISEKNNENPEISEEKIENLGSRNEKLKNLGIFNNSLGWGWKMYVWLSPQGDRSQMHITNSSVSFLFENGSSKYANFVHKISKKQC